MNKSNTDYCHLKVPNGSGRSDATEKTLCGLDDPGVYAYQSITPEEYPTLIAGVVKPDAASYPVCSNCKLALYRIYQTLPATDALPVASPAPVVLRKSSAMSEEPNGLPVETRSILNSILHSYTRAFRLRWRGSKIPRGASIDDDPISWTQHGIVYGTKSPLALGYYGRVSEFSGATGDEHEMLIATDGEVVAGPGQSVEQIHTAFPLTITTD